MKSSTEGARGLLVVLLVGKNQERLVHPVSVRRSRLFGPSPWKTLAATNEKNISEQSSPWRKSSKRKSCYGERLVGLLVA